MSCGIEIILLILGRRKKTICYRIMLHFILLMFKAIYSVYSCQKSENKFSESWKQSLSINPSNPSIFGPIEWVQETDIDVVFEIGPNALTGIDLIRKPLSIENCATECMETAGCHRFVSSVTFSTGEDQCDLIFSSDASAEFIHQYGIDGMTQDKV